MWKYNVVKLSYDPHAILKRLYRTYAQLRIFSRCYSREGGRTGSDDDQHDCNPSLAVIHVRTRTRVSGQRMTRLVYKGLFSSCVPKDPVCSRALYHKTPKDVSPLPSFVHDCDFLS